MIAIYREKVKILGNKLKELKNPMFSILFFTWMIPTFIHSIYVIIRVIFELINNTTNTSDEYIYEFCRKIFNYYTVIVAVPFFIKKIYCLIYRKPVLNKPLSEHEKEEIVLAAEILWVLIFLAYVFPVICKKILIL